MDPPKLKLATVRRRLFDLARAEEKAIAEFRRQRQAIIARCPHEWKYYYDPAGGSDSGYCCDCCGEWAKKT